MEPCAGHIGIRAGGLLVALYSCAAPAAGPGAPGGVPQDAQNSTGLLLSKLVGSPSIEESAFRSVLGLSAGRLREEDVEMLSSVLVRWGMFSI